MSIAYIPQWSSINYIKIGNESDNGRIPGKCELIITISLSLEGLKEKFLLFNLKETLDA